MDYQNHMLIHFQEEPNVIPKRLEAWSQKYQFTPDEPKNQKESQNTWVYKRGSHFRGSCSFDVRCVPTKVTIQYHEENQSLFCSFHVKSFFYRQMRSDALRVDEQLELLIAYLKNVFDEKLSFKE